MIEYRFIAMLGQPMTSEISKPSACSPTNQIVYLRCNILVLLSAEEGLRTKRPEIFDCFDWLQKAH